MKNFFGYFAIVVVSLFGFIGCGEVDSSGADTTHVDAAEQAYGWGGGGGCGWGGCPPPPPADDCDACEPPPEEVCGNGSCLDDETCETCEADCGACEPPEEETTCNPNYWGCYYGCNYQCYGNFDACLLECRAACGNPC